MSIERTYYCEGPDCGGKADDPDGTPRHATTATPPPYLPMGFLRVEAQESENRVTHHFCGWDCVMKFAAKLPPEEIQPWPPTDKGD